jgi:uncharacterized protein
MRRAALVDLLKSLCSRVAPQWPIKDFVAVNPLHGYLEFNLLTAWQETKKVSDAELLMPLSFYRAKRRAGDLSLEDLRTALNDVKRENPKIFEAYELLEKEILIAIQSEEEIGEAKQPTYKTIAQLLTSRSSTDWEASVVEDISRYCAAHLDRGEATWRSPWRSESLYDGWRKAKRFDYRMELLGLRGFRSDIANLPASPVDQIHRVLLALEVPQEHVPDFLLCQFHSVIGWASHLRGIEFRDERPLESSDLIGLLAIRLTYDLALAERKSRELWECAWPVAANRLSPLARRQMVDELARYVGLVATENRFRQSLVAQLMDREDSIEGETNASRHQLVFCIDVRSEVIRRAVESVSSDIETFGFAGFFGLPFKVDSPDFEVPRSQCPVLLEPSFSVREEGPGNGNAQSNVSRDFMSGRVLKGVWKKFRQSAISCFAYVETLGILYLPKLLRGTLVNESRERQKRMAQALPVVQAAKASCLHVDLSLEEKCQFAERIVNCLGLTKHFGRLVVFVGHASETTNNPYQASLDCGACGGHSGEPNAKLAASLLNSLAVREKLKQRGIEIPGDTWFVAAVHNTTTDEIKLIPESKRPSWVDEELKILGQHLDQGGKAARQERARRFDMSSEFSPFKFAADWSEVRAEWGLVNNAAFVAAPRERTKGLALSGRVFLHSYDKANDDEGNVLEMILTAPVVVAHWINSQYYFSSVDPSTFGSGNKVLHNVVGRLGIIEGNSGDLQKGLPWQSVHDGEQLRHEPLRLTVVVDAEPSAIDAVVAKHDLVRNLVENRWIRLVAWRDNSVLERLEDGEWKFSSEEITAA